MIKAKVRFNFNAPKLDFTDKLEEIATRVVIPDIAAGIQEGKDIDDKTYPTLDPKTIKAKGHADPLIDTGKLFKSFYMKGIGKNRVSVRIRSERQKVAEALQIKGVRKSGGRRFFKFFGISVLAEKKAIRAMRSEIERRVARAR